MSEPQAPKVPKVRHALILWASEKVSVTVTEKLATVRLEVRGMEVDLELTEARTLADHLNRIARRIATRPTYKP